MRNLLCAFLFLAANPSFAQEEAVTPVHIIKIDAFKSIFSQLHFDYERYNGKRGATEIGVSIFYPQPNLSGFIGTLYNRFKYRGGGIELKRKFYLKQKRVAVYCAPELSCKYRYYDHQEFLLEGPANSSYAVWYKATGYNYTYGLAAIFGFSTRLTNPFVFDLSAGPGIGYDTGNRTINDRGRYNANVSSGRINGIRYFMQFSVKLGFGFKGR